MKQDVDVDFGVDVDVDVFKLQVGLMAQTGSVYLTVCVAIERQTSYSYPPINISGLPFIHYFKCELGS